MVGPPLPFPEQQDSFGLTSRRGPLPTRWPTPLRAASSSTFSTKCGRTASRTCSTWPVRADAGASSNSSNGALSSYVDSYPSVVLITADRARVGQLAITSILFGLVQLFLCYRVYKNPLVQIPLDEHGMPMLQNPEDGTPLPIGPDGKPILPAWLQPPKSSSKLSPAAATARRSSSTPLVKTPSRSSRGSSVTYGHSDGGQSAFSESEDSEARPLQKKAPTSEKTLGRDRSRRHGSRRSRR